MRALQSVRGTQDLLPETARRHRRVAETARTLAELYGFGEMATPIFEFTEVFSRPIGEHTDIVAKEMYTFADRGGEEITLRPENTAGVVRAVLSNGLTQSTPLKFFYNGPMFRYERPQKGRFRQFHQIGVELLGVSQPQADIEVIALGHRILKELGLGDRVALELNTLGDPDSRAALSSGIGRLFLGPSDRIVRGQPAPTRHQPVAHPQLERSGGYPDQRRCALVSTDYLSPESHDFFARVRDGLERHRHRLPAQPAFGARARLLHAHGIRVRHYRSRRAGHGAGRRAL